MSLTMKAVAALAFVGLSSHAFAAQHDAKVMEKYAAAIRKIESTNRYNITANAGRGRTVLGAYQILDTNLAAWSFAALGRSVSQTEFLRSPDIQDQIFKHRFGHYVRKYGPHGAARAWLGGEGAARGREGMDRFGSTPTSYASKFLREASRNPPNRVPATLEAVGG